MIETEWMMRMLILIIEISNKVACETTMCSFYGVDAALSAILHNGEDYEGSGTVL